MDEYSVKFVNERTLTDLFMQARFTGQQTLFPTTLSASEFMPPEIILEDSGGRVLGAAWQSSLEKLLSTAEKNGHTAQNNPNIPVVEDLVKSMKEIRTVIEERRNPTRPVAEIVPFPAK